MPKPLVIPDAAKQAIEFIKFWFSHPNAPDKIRIICLPSEYQKTVVKVQLKSREEWIERDRVRLMPDEVLEDLFRLNLRGFDIYYFCNAVRHDVTGNACNTDITHRLFLPLDIDVRLPCSLNRLESELGLKFSAVVKTSEREFPHYQLLLTIDGERGEEWTEEMQRVLCSRMQACCGSDAIADAKRILRLPGLKNWKGVTEKSEPSNAELMSWDVDARYSLEDLNESQVRFGQTELSHDCEAVHAAKVGTRAVGNGSGGNGNGHFPRWNEAFQKAEHGEYCVGQGERHNALLYWGAQMSADNMPLANVLSNLDFLASGACDFDYAKTDPADYAKVRRDVERKFHAIDAELSSLSISDFGEDTEEIHEAEYRDASEPPQPSADHLVSAIKESPSEQIVTCVGPVSSIAFAQLAAQRLKNEPKEAYFNWLADCLAGALRYGLEDAGSIAQLVSAMERRLVQVGALRGGQVFAPIVSGKKKKSWSMSRVVEDEAQVIVNNFLYQVSDLTSRYGKDLSELPQVMEVNRRRVPKAAKKDGKPKGGPKKSFGAKSGFVSVVSKEMSLRRGGRVQEFTPEEWAVGYPYQNGVLNLETWAREADLGVEERLWRAWQPNKAGQAGILDTSVSWLRYQHCSAANFLPRVALEHLSHEGTAWKTLCPRWDRFLSDSFGDDEQAKVGIHRIIGYCLLPDNPYQKYFFFEGVAGSGKGTVGELIHCLAGIRNGARLDIERMKSDAWLGPLEGKTICIIDEAEGTDIRVVRHALSQLAKVTGSGIVPSRVLNKDARDIEVTQKFLLITNRQLDAEDAGGQMARRAVPVYFGRKKEGGVIPLLHQGIFEEEGDVIATIAACEYLLGLPRGADMFALQGDAFETGKLRFEESTAALSKFLRSVHGRSVGNVGRSFTDMLVEIWIDREDGRRYMRKQLERKIMSEMAALGFRRAERGTIGELEDRQRVFTNCCVNTEALLMELEMRPDDLAREIRFRSGKKPQLLDMARELLQIEPSLLEGGGNRSGEQLGFDNYE